MITKDPQIYQSDDYLVLDFETDTSHGDYGHPVWKDNGIVLASYRRAGGKMVSVFGSEYEQETLLRECEDAAFLVCHNAKYELGWLRRIGLDLSKVVVFDTKLAEYVLLGNLAAGCEATGLPPRSTSLDACCRRRGWEIKDPVVDIMMHQGINPIEIPRPWLQGRCEQDVDTTERLFLEQRSALAATNRLAVLFTRCLLTPVLADMEFEGMCLDAERVEQVYEDNRKRLKELEVEFDEMAQGINWKSPVQVADFLYSPEPDGLGFAELTHRDGSPRRTSSGRKKADKATVESLKATNSRQRKFLKLRGEIGKVQAALSKSLEFFKGICDEYGGIFYAVFNQSRTATHRLSSSGHRYWIEQFDSWKTTQFQNMARVFKPLFKSRDGGLMIEIDGSQLEFRVAADLGDDEQAFQDITDPDFDAHCLTASVIFNWDYDELLAAYRDDKHPRHKEAKTARTKAKAHTFKPLYGGESGTKAEKAYYKYFKERYHGIAATQETWLEQVLYSKRLITDWGMRYYWPRAKRGNDGYANVKSSVYNYPVQAFATAEIIPIAVRSLYERLRGMDGVRLVNTVHDSVIVEADYGAVGAIRDAAIKAFGTDVYSYLTGIYGYDFRVPLGCGITIGTHWSEGTEESYNIWPNGKVEQVA